MNIKNAIRAVAAAATLAAVALPASAGYQVLDGWQLFTPTGNQINIGRLNLVSGSATVEQEVNGSGNAFVGAKFIESGQIFSISYTKENVVGAGDVGIPKPLFDGLQLTFSNVAGVVTGLNPGGGFKYQFTSGNFLMEGDGGVYAAGSIVGLGGNVNSTNIIGATNGDSTVLTVLGAILNPMFDLKDNTGTSLQADLLSGKVLFEAATNNSITGATLSNAKCSFDASKSCRSFVANSGGDAYLVRSIPEPGSLALAGLSLLGLAAIGRRKSNKG
ncbi:PEP-CTERM sorting domain-containing protein [Paucibacter sp. APW11]|uniref:PEP-CTERM sorting domain-containing protein n=1 Tax=Roseateles aquae TaxID=3077235 RepID=A0ABU3P5W7_9BURK|nr:PEP-CTERM sorting domain-containing protein [Paucibacter sp. APW11]MDT8997956.1 PEP-CTERM sorting domain-containing protein [Paucibacter sp. APW11]